MVVIHDIKSGYTERCLLADFIIKIKKAFYYLFYPVHLIVIFFLMKIVF